MGPGGVPFYSNGQIIQTAVSPPPKRLPRRFTRRDPEHADRQPERSGAAATTAAMATADRADAVKERAMVRTAAMAAMAAAVPHGSWRSRTAASNTPRLHSLQRDALRWSRRRPAPRRAAVPSIAANAAAPAVQFSPGCSSQGGGCVVNPANGNLLLQTSPPAGDAFYLPPILSFNSSSSASSEFGNGWTSTFSRSLTRSGSEVTIQAGDGSTSYYTSAWHLGYYARCRGNPTVAQLAVQ